MGALKKSVLPAATEGRSGRVSPPKRGWEYELELKALLWEAFGHFDLDKTPAREVYPMLDLALAQRAVWIEDVAMAVWGGEEKEKRMTTLLAGVRGTDEPQGLTEEQELASLRALSKDLAPKQARDLQKQVDFIEFCRKRGITWE